MNGERIRNLVDKIFISNGQTKKYWEVSNSVGQQWIFPKKGTKNFLSLFQPSSIKGKIVSFLLPFFRFFPFIAYRINIYPKELDINKNIKSVICKAFNIIDFDFGAFLGSPGRHQKITLMINRNSKCLGYCKISNNPDVFSIFMDESRNLVYLQSRGVANIPKTLFVGEVENLPGIYMFIQTTNRKRNVLVAKPKDECVFDFVINMFEATKCSMEYKNSDFAKSVEIVRGKLHLFNSNEQEIIINVINEIEKSLLGKNLYCAYHGDFTPWNSFVVDNKLYVFDLEYFRKHSIPYIDYFHFFTQSCIYDEYMGADAIYNQYKKIKDIVARKFKNPDFIYSCYLINIMAFYLERDNGFLNERIKQCFSIWISLINKIKYEFAS